MHSIINLHGSDKFCLFQKIINSSSTFICRDIQVFPYMFSLITLQYNSNGSEKISIYLNSGPLLLQITHRYCHTRKNKVFTCYFTIQFVDCD